MKRPTCPRSSSGPVSARRRRPLPPPVSRLVCRRAVRGRRLGGGLDDLRGRHQRRCRDHRGFQTPANHPVASSFFKQAAGAARSSSWWIPRERVADHADIYCQIKPAPTSPSTTASSRVHRDGPGRRGVHRQRTSNYEALVELLEQYSAERAGQICGISPRTLREVARMWGRPGRPSSTGAWGSPAHHRHRRRPLPHRAVRDHRAGRPPRHRIILCAARTTCRPPRLRLIPMFYPDYQPVDRPAAWERFERAWGRQSIMSAGSPSPRSSARR